MGHYKTGSGELVGMLGEINLESKTLRFTDAVAQGGDVEHKLSASAILGIQKLQYFLGDAAKGVRINFVKDDNGLQIKSLDTGPNAHDADALMKLNEILKVAGRAKQDFSHGFDDKQTELILQRLEMPKAAGRFL